MKRVMLTSMIILFNVLFVSCASNEPIDISSIEKEVAEELAEDPFKEAESQMKVLGSLGHGLNDKLDENEFIEYSGTDVRLIIMLNLKEM